MESRIVKRPTAVEMFDLAIAKGEVKIEDEDTVLLERLLDLEAESDMIQKFATFHFNLGCNSVAAANAEWWDMIAAPQLREAGVSEVLLQQLGRAAHAT